MQKPITSLTEPEAQEILSFVFPDKDFTFMCISHEPHLTPNGGQYLTFGARPIIGIEYHNGQDRCILHFDNTKVVQWLYAHGYDITEQLEINATMSQELNNFDNFAFGVSCLARGADGFAEEFKHNWTLDYVTKKCTELLGKYYYNNQ